MNLVALVIAACDLGGCHFIGVPTASMEQCPLDAPAHVEFFAKEWGVNHELVKYMCVPTSSDEAGTPA